jgi:putative heme iron utilization protein
MNRMEQDLGGTVRYVMRRCGRVGLGTLERDGSGPYVSLAMVALDHDATPLLLLSDLADHTRNLKADPRVSLLFDGTLGSAVPLAGERATVQGRIEPARDPRLLGRYVARHPDAAGYAGFGDFNLYRVLVERAHLVAGFGRIDWLPAASIMLASAASAPLLAQEQALVEQVNREDAAAVRRYAERLTGQPGDGWAVTGIDPEGCDLRRGAEVARLWFEEAAHDAARARSELLRLAREGRPRAAGK